MWKKYDKLAMTSPEGYQLGCFSTRFILMHVHSFYTPHFCLFLFRLSCFFTLFSDFTLHCMLPRVAKICVIILQSFSLTWNVRVCARACGVVSVSHAFCGLHLFHFFRCVFIRMLLQINKAASAPDHWIWFFRYTFLSDI